MGVPAFFRWLSTKYPKTVEGVKVEAPQEVDGEVIPVDYTGPNPNGEEFDNLYLDMNGIVHPCSHPEDKPPPKDEEEMMLEIFKYTESVVQMVRPRKILMMAVDGVAPRAKMNQQRSRRFRSAQEAKEKDDEKEEFRKLLLSKERKGGVVRETPAEAEKTWDSNVITPGTPFMHMLSQALKYWVAYKLNTDPMWAKLKVIISDASVPGEGEHKIMEFVRSQRRSPEHDPNTRHVIYGLDADLIMLGMATHEPHFRVLREDVFQQAGKANNACHTCGQPGHRAAECQGKPKEKVGEFDEKTKLSTMKPHIWLKLNVLREYLAEELFVHNLPFKFDLERAIDDWVFLCFFVGNDFLPHLPSLSIREEGIDALVAGWRDNLPIMGGFVSKDGHVDLARAQIILGGLAKQEDAIFKRRKEMDDRQKANQKRRKLQNDNNHYSPGNSGRGTPNGRGRGGRRGPQENHADVQLFSPGAARTEVKKLTHEMMVNKKANFQAEIADANVANKSAAAVLKEQLKKKTSCQAGLDQDERMDDGADTSVVVETEVISAELQTTPSALGKRKADLLEDDTGTPGSSTPISVEGTPRSGDSDDAPPDDVRLWEDGYADRYYEAKFGRPPSDLEFRKQVAASYVEGVCWVLLYYMQGCPSWTWYFPYHYAPFAADFVGIADQKIEFDGGGPSKPYEQLMGVFPAASRHAIPEAYHSLMTDPDSEIIDFYPEDFVIDLNGKPKKWMGVAILPFIEQPRLLAAMEKRFHLLSEDEKARNTIGSDYLLFSAKHPMYDELAMNWYSKKQGDEKLQLNPKITEGLSGKVEKNEEYLPEGTLIYPFNGGDMPDIPQDMSMSVIYEMPKSNNIHKSMLLRGVEMPPKVLDQGDIDKAKHNRNSTGRSFGGAPLRSGYNNGNGRGGGQFSYANSNSNQYAPPPPHIAAQMGMLPPGFVPPPGFPPPPGLQLPQQQPYNNGGGGGHAHSNSYNSGHQNQGLRGGYNGGGGQREYRDSYSGGGSRDSYPGGGSRDSYSGGGSRDSHSGGGSRGGRRDDYSNGHSGGGGGRGGRGGRGRGNYNGGNDYSGSRY